MFILQLWCYFYSVGCSKVLWRSNQCKMRENFFCVKSNNAVLVNGIKGETICNLLHSLALNNENKTVRTGKIFSLTGFFLFL